MTRKRKEYPWKLPPEIEARLGETTYGRQRAIYEAEHLLLILHVPPSPADHQREAQVFLRMPDGKYLYHGRENGDAQLRQLLGSYERLYEQFDKAYDESNSADDLFRILEPLGPIARAATNLGNALQSARELVPDDPFLIAMRDEAHEVAQNLELLLADAKTALDYRIAQHAEVQTAKAQEMATAQHKLNVLAAITLPLMAVATVFGMNLANGMEGQYPLLFWVVFATSILVGLATKAWVTNGASAAAVKTVPPSREVPRAAKGRPKR